MHFVTGGAFNGKSKWVKAYNQINEENSRWMSAYGQGELPGSFDSVGKDMIILEGIELWVKELLNHLDESAVREKWQKLLQQWRLWETSKPGRLVVLIGSDITKGIVPASLKERIWRDVTGRVFQDTAAASERVDLIWYGINQKLK
ncbi:bifunctional adenosylcobinamide kinase/adenosylcobinamide-phosphate guanylyltransferase [Niallia oryzisoli]|uniref:bifunctional adenosylcobinamide kinase/adenosylcobinamide-phosphate guanylyltransferase n=1 Tax=Niallia oryzisoli TaxID=1737571 RepID=UPI0037353613